MKSTLKEEAIVLDLIGVGVGPFNLSMASLIEPIKSIQSIFFESKSRFDWHAGLLMEDCTLQVPFMADLVTMVDPTSPFSYLNYLHQKGRLYQFYFYENFQIPRLDYNLYCRWVSEQLSNVQFNYHVISIAQKNDLFYVTVKDSLTGEFVHYIAHNIVLGVGSIPSWPEVANECRNVLGCVHSAEYLYEKSNLIDKKSITVIGSGQSAAEIFLDLLNEQDKRNYELNWLTRSEGFFPMEHSKLGLEHFSPEYIDYFHNLPEDQRDKIRSRQNLWYKGISVATIADIYDRIYKRSITGGESSIVLQSLSELNRIQHIDNKFKLTFQHIDQRDYFQFESECVILATGYKYPIPQCIEALKPLIQFDSSGRIIINRDYTIELNNSLKGKLFVQHAEMHSHGIGAPDLGLGAYRSAVIINSIAGEEYYTVRKKNVYQNFGVPENWLVKNGEALTIKNSGRQSLIS
jgi:lysine N6-hydroxylase